MTAAALRSVLREKRRGGGGDRESAAYWREEKTTRHRTNTFQLPPSGTVCAGQSHLAQRHSGKCVHSRALHPGGATVPLCIYVPAPRLVWPPRWFPGCDVRHFFFFHGGRSASLSLSLHHPHPLTFFLSPWWRLYQTCCKCKGVFEKESSLWRCRWRRALCGVLWFSGVSDLLAACLGWRLHFICHVYILFESQTRSRKRLFVSIRSHSPSLTGHVTLF